MTGKITAIVRDRGFGFIDKQYFFHTRDVVNAEWEALNVGDNVEFTPHQRKTTSERASNNGLTAVSVRLIA